MEKGPITLADGRIITVTASFGLYGATQQVSLEHMLDQADKALYRAKQSGRNRVEKVLSQG